MYSPPIFSTTSFDVNGSYTTTFIPNASATSATCEPILPIPIMPRVFLYNSVPVNLERSHLPSFVEQAAGAMFLAIASIRAIVCSDAAIVLPSGEFTTIIPFWVADSRLMLSTPTPARPIILRFFPASIILGVTFVWLLTISASY